MNIGIDIDGVLLDIGDFVLKNGTDYFSKKYNLSVIDAHAYTVEEIFGCTHKQGKRFWAKYGLDYWVKQPYIKDSKEVIDNLYKDGHSVYLITSRVFTAEKGILPSISRFLLLHWLSKHHIKYEEITYCRESSSAKDKLEACLEYGIKVMVDDTPKNLLLLKDKLYTICYTAPWNETLNDDKITRADNWGEVYSLISDFSEKSTKYKQ